MSVTLLFWRESPVGLLVLCLMCGGDGLADIAGRRYGSAKLPFNHSKSWVGSAAMITGKADAFADMEALPCYMQSAYITQQLSGSGCTRLLAAEWEGWMHSHTCYIVLHSQQLLRYMIWSLIVH